MKKTLFLSVILLFLLSFAAQATDFGFTTFYPVPTGNYQKIRLVPRLALPTNNCQLGTMYANSSNNDLPYFCLFNTTLGLSQFTLLSGPWTLTGNDLYLTDTSTPTTKKVAIGTATPIFKLTVANDGGILADGLASTSSDLPIAVSGGGTRLIWYPKKGAFRAGYIPADQWDDTNIGTNSMAMGYGNIASTQGASVWGGQNNSASGGSSPWTPVIIGGQSNTTTSELAQILGGQNNRAGVGTRIFGTNNISNGNYSMIGGGQSNAQTSNLDNYNTISGGFFNRANTSVASTISGGIQNISVGNYNTISGGIANRLNAGSSYSTFGGGYNSSSNATYTVISGGREQTMTNSNYATISGGVANFTTGLYGTINGGNNNVSSVLGSVTGNFSLATGNAASILGGGNGLANTASADHSTVIGGGWNRPSGYYSLAAGKGMAISGNHSFVWGYENSIPLNLTSSDALIIYSGSMGIRDISPAALLEINANGSVIEDYLNLTSSSAAIPGDIFKINPQGYIGIHQPNPTHLLEFGNGAYVSNTGNFVDSSNRSHCAFQQSMDL